MNDLIARARDLDRAATPGPWVVDKRKIHDSVHYTIRTRDRQPERPHSEAYLFWMCGSLGQAAYNSNPADYADDQIVKRNGDFIAESRTLLPALADALEIERKARAEWEIEAQDLRDRVVQLDRELATSRAAHEVTAQERDRALTELAMMRAWVEQARPVVEAVRAYRQCTHDAFDECDHESPLFNLPLPPKEQP